MFYEFDEETGAPQLTGMTIEIARLLEKELNCKFQFILGDPSRPELQSGALAAVGQIPGGAKARADVAGGGLHITANQTHAVHWTLPFYDTGYVMVVPMPAYQTRPWGFFDPFHSSLWTAIILEIFVVATGAQRSSTALRLLIARQ